MSKKPYSFDDIFMAVSDEETVNNPVAQQDSFSSPSPTQNVSASSSQQSGSAKQNLLNKLPTAQNKPAQTVQPTQPTIQPQVSQSPQTNQPQAPVQQSQPKNDDFVMDEISQELLTPKKNTFENVTTNFSMNAIEQSGDKTELLSNMDSLMNKGRKESVNSYKRESSTKKKVLDYYKIEHDKTYYDENSDYDGFYEDILPIDYEQVESARKAKKMLSKAITIVLILSLVAIAAVVLFIRYLLS